MGKDLSRKVPKEEKEMHKNHEKSPNPEVNKFRQLQTENKFALLAPILIIILVKIAKVVLQEIFP